MKPQPRFTTPHVALVTGASSGIGAATAVQFGQSGSHVAVHYHKNRDAAEEIVRQIQNNGAQAEAFQANLSKREEAVRLAQEVMQTWNRIDVLVNNAGALVDRRMLDEITPDFWEEVFDVNVSSALWLTQAVAPHMQEAGSGAIVNLTSVAARNGGSPGAMPYAASKAAVLCMTKGMARELISKGIRVNAVSPGVIATPFHERFTPPDRMRALVSNIPQGRAGDAQEVARVIAFLASCEASHVVGETIEVNGGLIMD